MKVKQHIRISLKNNNTNVHSNSLELISSNLDVRKIDDNNRRVSISRIIKSKKNKKKDDTVIITNSLSFKIN